jgi:hypothetical protein
MTAPSPEGLNMKTLIWKLRCAIALIMRTDIRPSMAWEFANSLHGNWGIHLGPVEAAEMDMEYWND